MDQPRIVDNKDRQSPGKLVIGKVDFQVVEWPGAIAGAQPSKVGSRADAMLLRSDLFCCSPFPLGVPH
jgi:hypothetical protein